MMGFRFELSMLRQEIKLFSSEGFIPGTGAITCNEPITSRVDLVSGALTPNRTSCKQLFFFVCENGRCFEKSASVTRRNGVSKPDQKCRASFSFRACLSCEVFGGHVSVSSHLWGSIWCLVALVQWPTTMNTTVCHRCFRTAHNCLLNGKRSPQQIKGSISSSK